MLCFGWMGPLATFASVSRFHIVVIAALGTLTFGWLFTGQYLFEVMAIAACDWFIVNLLNRVVDQKEDRHNQIHGVDFVARYAKVLRAVGLVLLFGSIGVVHVLEPRLTIVRALYHLLGIFYNYPLLPGRVRLKQLYVVKNVASAMGFLLTCFGYPLAKADWGMFGLPIGIDGMTLLLTAGFFFLFELSYEVIYDLRDVQGDRAARVETLPVVLGPELTVRIIDQLIFFSVVILVVGFTMYFVPWRILVMAAAPILQYVLYKRAYRRGITAKDCINLTWIGAGLLVTYHLWIYLGLPGVLA